MGAFYELNFPHEIIRRKEQGLVLLRYPKRRYASFLDRYVRLHPKRERERESSCGKFTKHVIKQQKKYCHATGPKAQAGG